MRCGAAFFVKVKVKCAEFLACFVCKVRNDLCHGFQILGDIAQIVIMGATESSYRKLGATVTKLQCVPRKRIEVDDTDGRVSNEHLINNEKKKEGKGFRHKKMKWIF